MLPITVNIDKLSGSRYIVLLHLSLGVRLAKSEVCRAPGLFESWARVQCRQRYACNRHKAAFKYHEADLIVGQGAMEAITQLRNTEAAPN